jgi:hypothetical protein
MADPVAAALRQIRNREEAVRMPFSPHRCCELSQRDVPRLLAVLDALLAEHGSVPWDEWAARHPPSRDPDVDRVSVCPACTREHENTCDCGIPEYARDCTVRATIARVLTGGNCG